MADSLSQGRLRAERRSWFEHVAGRPRSIQRQQFYLLATMFAPVVALFLIIRVIPIVLVLLASVTDFNIQRPQAWHVVGLENFARLLDDSQFQSSFWGSLQFVIIGVPAEIILGLALAFLVNNKLRLEGLYQTLYFLPYILPMVPTVIIWKWIYAPGTAGLANYLLHSFGAETVGWLARPDIAIKAIIAMHIWKNLGFFMVIFLVGLKAIPAEYKEAAAVDGANWWHRIRHIELPLLRPIILFGVVMGTIWAWSVFTEVYVMTQGTDISAGTDVQVIVTRLYQEGFRYYNMGYASAMSFVLFLVSLLFVAVQFRLFRTETAGDS